MADAGLFIGSTAIRGCQTSPDRAGDESPSLPLLLQEFFQGQRLFEARPNGTGPWWTSESFLQGRSLWTRHRSAAPAKFRPRLVHIEVFRPSSAFRALALGKPNAIIEICSE